MFRQTRPGGFPKVTIKKVEASVEQEGDVPPEVDGKAVDRPAVAARELVVPKRRTTLAIMAEKQARADEAHAPVLAAAREKAIRQAHELHEAREAGPEALMQLIAGHPGVRTLVTPVNGKAEFELTQEEADELFRRDFKRMNRGKAKQAHQRRKPKPKSMRTSV